MRPGVLGRRGVSFWISVSVNEFGEATQAEVVGAGSGFEDDSLNAANELAQCEYIPGFADGSAVTMEFREFMVSHHMGRH